MKNNRSAVVVAIIFVGLLVLLTDPFMAWMPEAGLTAALTASAVLMGIWMGFVAYEHAEDEREETHRIQAGQAAYLFGIGMLTIALVVQGFRHAIDPWISATLAVMVLVKLGARLYAARYR